MTRHLLIGRAFREKYIRINFIRKVCANTQGICCAFSHLSDAFVVFCLRSSWYIQTRFQKSWDTVQIVNKNRMQ